MSIIHGILRTYIGRVRNEHYTPNQYTVEMLKADNAADTPSMSVCNWDVPLDIGKRVFDVLGYSSNQQFKIGIVRQPGHTENLIICSELRGIFGDLSSVPGFDGKGNFVRTGWHDLIIPFKVGWRIERLKTYSSRDLVKYVNWSNKAQV